MRRLISLALLSTALSSCGPERPQVTVCAVVFAKDNCRCRDPKGKKFDITLKECNNFLALSPQDGNAIFNYMTDIEKQNVQLQKELDQCHSN